MHDVVEHAARDSNGLRPLPGQLALPHDRGVVVADGSLDELAELVAARQPAKKTRRTYGAAGRSLCTYLRTLAGAGMSTDHPAPVPVGALTIPTLIGWRDDMEDRGLSTSTIAVYLTAGRHLAAELGIKDADKIRSGKVVRGRPRPLTSPQLERLLKQPDRRTRVGKRDYAILLLGADAGLRREEIALLEPDQFEVRERHASAAFRRAIRGSTAMAVRIQLKRGHERLIPLTQRTVDAVQDWMRSRPACATTRVFVSLSHGRDAKQLGANAIYKRVRRHAIAAGLPDDRLRVHTLRHTFATLLRANGTPVEVIRDLLGHADIRTTMIYTEIDDVELEKAINALEWANSPLVAA